MINYEKNYNTLNALIQEMYVTDLKSSENFKMLTEEDKKSISKELVRKLFTSIKNKSLHVDFSAIEKTKGNVATLSGYQDLTNSINYLQSMYQYNSDKAPKEIPVLKRSLDILIKYRKEFEKAFATKQETKILFYDNMYAALISSTAFLISASIMYIKTPAGDYKAIFKDTAKNAVTGDLTFKNLDKLVKMESSGKLRQFLTTNDLISESTYFTTEYLNNENDVTSLNEGIIAITAGIILLLITVLFVIKSLIFKFYECRVTIAEYLIQMAYFVECNIKNLDSDNKKNKKIIEKQQKAVKKLLDLAEKIKVEDREANRSAQQKDEDDNKQIEKEAKTDSENGDILI